MKKIIVLLTLFITFTFTPVSAELPSNVPFYEWGTDFETIAKEHELVLLDLPSGKFHRRFLASEGKVTTYDVTSATIYSKKAPIANFMYVFSDEKLVSIFLFIRDKSLYTELIRTIGFHASVSRKITPSTEEVHYFLGGRRTMVTDMRNSSDSFKVIVLTDTNFSPYTEVMEKFLDRYRHR